MGANTLIEETRIDNAASQAMKLLEYLQFKQLRLMSSITPTFACSVYRQESLTTRCTWENTPAKLVRHW